MILNASGKETKEVPGGYGLLFWVGVPLGILLAIAVIFGVVYGIVQLWFAVGVWTLLILYVATLLFMMVRKTKANVSLNVGFGSYRGARRAAELIFYTMCLIGAGFLIFYIVSAGKAWSGDVVDRSKHPMKDRGENTVCYNPNLVSVQNEGTYTFEPEKRFQYFKVRDHGRTYRTLNGKKILLRFAQKDNAANQWQAEIGPSFDDQRLVSGIPSSVNSVDYIITVSDKAPVQIKFSN